MTTNNWDQVSRHPGDAADSRVDDGFGGAEPAVTRAPGDTIEAEDAVVTPRKRKGVNPRLMAGGLGLLIVGVVAFFGIQLASKLSGKPSPTPALPMATAMAATPTVDQPAKPSVGEGTVLMDANRPSNTTVLPSTPNVGAPATALAPAQSLPPTSPPGREADPDERVGELTDRVTRVESSLRDLTAKVSAAGAAATAPTRKPRPASVADAAATPHTTKPRAGRDSKRQAAVITEEREVPTPVEISRLQLKGVFPPTGEDMQAWIMDGDKTHTVSKGSVINGAMVTRVETDRVVTTRGVIR